MKINDNAKKYILIAAGVAAVGALGFWIYRGIKRRKYAQQAIFGGGTDYADALQELTKNNNFQKEIEAQATITKTKARALANQIKNAWGGMGNDDEEAVYDALNQLNNTSDWLLVVDAYGINSATFADRDLKADLKYRLSGDEYNNAISILRNKGIEI